MRRRVAKPPLVGARVSRSLAVLLLVIVPPTLLSACGEEEGEEACVSTYDYFNEHVWQPILQKNCIGCHNPQGEARESKLVLQSATQPGAVATNLAIVENVARYEYDGTSILLMKPANRIDHGGGLQVSWGSAEFERLENLVGRFLDPVECEEEEGVDVFAGVVMLTPVETLRKASLNLVGRLPTPEEDKKVSEGGLAALDEVLGEMMSEEPFYERLKLMYNDMFLTDRYLGGNNATNLLSGDDYPLRRWYDDDEYTGHTEAYKELGDDYANDSVARAPLELIAHVVRNDRPFSEILTADYMLVNPFSAISYSVHGKVAFANNEDPEEFHEVRLPGIPHAGVLTSPMFLNRFPTTDTNRNRHRSRIAHEFFLATDVQKLAERPIDPTKVEGHNPTMNDPNCSICHATIDPVAGAFQNWTASGRYISLDEQGWFEEMRPPGFGEATVPPAENSRSLQWLAKELVKDARFARSVVQTVFVAMTGQEVLAAVEDPEAEGAAAKQQAFEAQDAFFVKVAQDFAASDFDFKLVVKEIVKSDYYRAKNTFAPELSEEEAEVLDQVGTAHLLTPEQLSAKIEATTGYPWRNRPQDRDYLLGDYEIFYGGIDSNAVTERISEPNGIMANVIRRMANEVACRVTARDFTKNRAERALFPEVETTFTPEDENGFIIDGAVDAILANIQHLHRRLLGEVLPADDPEIQRTYDLFYETWSEGSEKVLLEQWSDYLPNACRATTDWWTGEDLSDDKRVSQDEKYTVRAWMAVMAYLLSDYKYLYE